MGLTLFLFELCPLVFYSMHVGLVFNLEIGHRGSCWPRQHLTGGQIWKLGVNVKRQRTPSDVNTSCVIGL
jgi:hypothetical protein